MEDHFRNVQRGRKDDLEAEWKPFLRPPARRKVTTPVMAKGKREGFGTFSLMLGADDRTRLLLPIIRQTYTCNSSVNVDDIRVVSLDGNGKTGIYIVFRVIPQPNTTRDAFLAYADGVMETLERQLAKLDGQSIPGERFAPARIVEMTVNTPHRPGQLLAQVEAIDSIGGNISELTCRSFSDRALLSYTIVLPADDDKQLADMKKTIEATPAGAQVAYDADADEMEKSFPSAMLGY